MIGVDDEVINHAAAEPGPFVKVYDIRGRDVTLRVLRHAVNNNIITSFDIAGVRQQLSVPPPPLRATAHCNDSSVLQPTASQEVEERIQAGEVAVWGSCPTVSFEVIGPSGAYLDPESYSG